ncbi:MAG TPA: hypothetical protein VI258_03455, partial [Rhodanobacteraceae bacterium]
GDDHRVYLPIVIPAKAGNHFALALPHVRKAPWTPASAGMTVLGRATRITALSSAPCSEST